jgi:basic amino acid/polyamine antiporter, APA family
VRGNRIGLISLVSIVISSQLGVGMFIIPSSFARYGTLGLLGWVASGASALLLGLVFCELFKLVPRTGGPYLYVRQAFGDMPAFFTGWAHWIVGAVSNVPLVLSGTEYLARTLGKESFSALWQVALLTGITFLSFFGGRFVARAETLLSSIKLLPIAIVPIAAVWFFEPSHFANFNPSGETWTSVIKTTALMSMWCFIGLEAATIPGEMVENAQKTVPKAILIGTIAVLIIYVSNSIGIMSIVPPEALCQSQAPYAEASRVIFGGAYSSKIITASAALVCIGSLNAWIFSGGFISKGLALDGFLPKAFLAQNKFGAPYVGLSLAYAATLSFLLLCLKQGFKKGLSFVIDTSVVAALEIYALCALSLMCLLIKKKQVISWKFACGLLSLTICIWMIFSAGALPLAVSASFFLSGLPVYLYMKRAR